MKSNLVYCFPDTAVNEGRASEDRTMIPPNTCFTQDSIFWFFGFFLSCGLACGILVPWPGIEPRTSAVRVQSSNTGPPSKSQGSSPFVTVIELLPMISPEKLFSTAKVNTTSLAVTLTWYFLYISNDTVLCSITGNGTPLQYSCLDNSMDRGAWWAIVHGVLRSQTQLSD